MEQSHLTILQQIVELTDFHFKKKARIQQIIAIVTTILALLGVDPEFLSADS